MRVSWIPSVPVRGGGVIIVASSCGRPVNVGTRMEALVLGSIDTEVGRVHVRKKFVRGRRQPNSSGRGRVSGGRRQQECGRRNSRGDIIWRRCSRRRRCSGWRGFPMHICDEGAESENILPQTRDDGRQGANVTANVVVDGVVKPSDGRSSRGMGGSGLHEGSHSGSDVGRILCSSGLHVGSSCLQVRNPCV